ncbi:DNA polymerase alpha zinc finger domain-containing protein [Ditylenchus destructor]|uniref:DNA polymerase alpha zinc finger domain-containing protein n=1 Tax=Ditylenchus destructor TaxID=166010 RepID=A0AAD4N707_9BILA|nr:DNA polymerase alpha zinc finger domain-containing protein [Ditylenchus destructor]
MQNTTSATYPYLGIDSARLRPHYASEAPENNEEDFDIGIEQDFNNCEGLSVECPKCKHVSIIRSAMIDMDGVKKLSLENCSECELSYNDHFGAILKKLIISLRNMVEKNVKSPFICDDMTCNAQILVPPPNCLTADGYVCPQCQNGILRKMHSCKKLFDQQCFYKKIFDLDAYKKNELTREEQNALIIRPGHNEYAKNYKRALAIVERFLQHNDFNKVDLSVVFAPLFRRYATVHHLDNSSPATIHHLRQFITCDNSSPATIHHLRQFITWTIHHLRQFITWTIHHP